MSAAPQKDANANANANAGPSSAEAPAASGFSSGIVTIPLPRVFGRLLLLKLLARGGMGDVYLAATTGIEGAERPCVVKTVRRDHIHDGSFLARFLDEARVQAQLNHPGVAQVLEASNDENGEPYTVVEYVEGRSLADVRQRAVQLGARIGWPEAVALAIELGQGLSHVHERSGADGTPLGIVHRDLSPQNVMIGYAGELKLIDFGTARGHNRRCHTVAGVVFAKPGYVAPEVARQEVGDGRIDVYAMGVMLWELCAGKRLLNGDPQKHLEEVAGNKFDVPPLAPTRGIPKELDDAIARLIANDPDERYASAHIAAADLARVLAQAPAGKNGERSVRARIAALMKTLWPQEPGRSRGEFAKLLKDARGLARETDTPPASAKVEAARASMTDDPNMLSGTPYRLERKIGEGASGAVFEAEHVELGRKLAVKILAPSHTTSKDAVDRFRREARAIAGISHPNLVALHDFGKSIDGRVFLAMELLEGETLEKRATRPIGWKEAVRLAMETTKALAVAHTSGLVHRDLKPQNLFLTNDGGLKLLDFGVAVALGDAKTDAPEKRQRGFAIFGTPEYMAPEQVAGETVDARADLYALGCVLYELVTGSRPFSGESSVEVMGKQLREPLETPRARAPEREIPVELEAVIVRALEKSPSARFASAEEMRRALEKALLAREVRRSKGKKVAIAIGIASLAILLGAGYKLRANVEPHAVTRAEPISMPAVPIESLPKSGEPAPPVTGTPADPAPLAVEPRGAAASDEEPTLDPRALGEETAQAPPSPPQGLTRAAARESTHARGLGDARAQAKAHPGEPRALKAWTLAALRAGDTREAKRAAIAWASHENTEEPRLVLATILAGNGRHADARALLTQWLATHPGSPGATKMLEKMGGADPTVAAKAPDVRID